MKIHIPFSVRTLSFYPCKAGLLIGILIFSSLVPALISFQVHALEAVDQNQCFTGNRQGKVEIRANKCPLGQILKKIGTEWKVDISGLIEREEDRITFTGADTSKELLLKRFFRKIGEDNYAFEFNKVGLTKVSVLPKGKAGRPIPKIGPGVPVPKANEQYRTAVQVRSVLRQSQAENAGIKEKDLIVRYDGVPVRTSKELIREVKKRSENENVAITVIRDGESLEFGLKGGQIGVRITNTRIAKELLDQWIAE